MRDLWKMVNECESHSQIAEAEKELLAADISCEFYNDLMMALTEIQRELYREGV